MGKKTFKEPENWDQLSDDTKENLRLHHNWVNMLTVVPGISEAKARRITSVYSSVHALMDVYMDERLNERAKQLLLQDLFRENSGGGGGGGGKGKDPTGGAAGSGSALLSSQSATMTSGKGTSTVTGGKGSGGNTKTTGVSSAKQKTSNKPLVATKTMRQVTPLCGLILYIYPLTS